MKKHSKLRLIIAIICFAFCIKVNALSNELYDIKVNGYLHYEKAQEVLKLVNEERRKQGLNELQMDNEFLENAMTRAMENGILFSHTRPNGTKCFSISGKVFGENIAAGNTTAAGTMSQWMASPGHRANILNSNYKSIGIGVFQNGSVYYWVQLFGYSTPSEADNKSEIVPVEKSISILKDSVTVYAFTVKNGIYYGKLLPGESGYFKYGIKNNGWNRVYSPGVASDYIFTTSNNKVIAIDNKGNFIALSKGEATISVCLKVDNTNCFSETIIVENDPYKEETDEDVLKGDLNKNENVDLTDVLIELKIYFRNIVPSLYQNNAGDMNNDGCIDLTDVLTLLKLYFKSN